MSLLWPITTIPKSRGKEHGKISGVCEVEEEGLYLILPANKKKSEVGISEWVGVGNAILKTKKGTGITTCYWRRKRKTNVGLHLTRRG